jgi:hypothetical protein
MVLGILEVTGMFFTRIILNNVIRLTLVFSNKGFRIFFDQKNNYFAFE